MKVGTAIAKILKMEGIDCATCFPSNPLFDFCAEEGIRLVLFRNENVAAQAADGFTRASFGKRHGVLLVQAGPGLEVALPGIRQAASDNIPVLVLPSTEAIYRITTFPYYDAASVFQPLVKYSETLYFPQRTMEIFRRAFTYLKMGKQGPALIALPKEVINADLPDELFTYRPVKTFKPSGDPALVKEAITMLRSAKNPLIRAGQGVLMSEGWDSLRELAEWLQIPVTTTLNGKSAFPENHPLYVGCGARGHTGGAKHFYNKADLVFAVGSSCTTDPYIFTIPPGKKLIQLTINEQDINKDYPVDLGIIGDARIVLGQLVEEAKKQTGGKGGAKNNALVEEIKAVNGEWMKKWLPKLTSNEVPIHPHRVYWDLMKTLDRKETIVTADAGTPRDALSAFWESLIPGGFINYGKDHMLGAGMGLAMGAKLARPDKTVIHIGGDAAFGQAGMDWETAVREKIAIINVVLNNGKMSGTHKMFPGAVGKYHINSLSGNYSKIAEGMGSDAERVEKPEDIVPAVQRAQKLVNSGKPVLLEFVTRVEDEEPV
jgi:acetolactate synthase-1/2/3 large subunit